MSQDYNESTSLLSSHSSQAQKDSHYSRGRRQSCSPTREIKLADSNFAFSTIRRTRSPYRKQNLENFQDMEHKVASNRRPPIPRKFKNAQSVTDDYHQPISLATYKGKSRLSTCDSCLRP